MEGEAKEIRRKGGRRKEEGGGRKEEGGRRREGERDRRNTPGEALPSQYTPWGVRELLASFARTSPGIL